MRLGIFGGSFDPPHVGHLLAASDAVEALGLDRLIFIPAWAQPLKDRPSAAGEHRLEMVRRLAAGDPRFEVDPVEVERNRLSYTVETLDILAARAPAAKRFLLVGADVLSSFGRWREPARIRELAELVVLQRGSGEGAGTDESEAIRVMRESGGAAAGEAVRTPPRVLRTRRVDVSSTEIRARVRDGRSIHGFVPESVAAYIEENKLYR